MQHLFRALPMAAFAAAAMLVTPVSAHAGERTWVLCVPMPFRACASIFLKTTPTISGGTDFLVRVHNFQGQGLYGDAAEWSAITEVSFWDIIGEPNAGAGIEGGTSTGTPLGGASGPAPLYSWTATHGNAPGLGTVLLTNNNWPNQFGVIGCDYGPYGGGGFGVAGVKTCVSGSHVDFSFTTAQAWEATEFGSLRLGMVGWAGYPPNGYTGKLCQSNPGLHAGTQGTTCDVISIMDGGGPGVVPEPASVALVVTGLLGLGGVAIRRRGQQRFPTGLHGT